MVTRFDIGQAVNKFGTALGLPEYGLSESIGGYNRTYDYIDRSGVAAPATNFVRKADGGYDFFVNGHPASFADYVAAGGQTPAGMQTSTPLSQIYPSTPSAPTSTGITGGTTYEPNIVVTPWDMQRYDLNNPGDLQRYIQSADTYYNGVLSQYEQNAANLRDIDIAEAVAEEERTRRNIEMALEALSEKERQYEQDYIRSLADLAEGFRQGSAKRQSFYASIAPRVYQSSQGTSQNYAQNKYKEGQTRYGEEKERVGKEFGRARTGYMQNIKDLENQVNLYKTRRQAEYEGDIASKREDIAGRKANLLAADATARASSNKFKSMDIYNPGALDYSPSQVNLNDLMQFIKFQPVGVAGGVSTARTQAIATPEAGGQSLGTYLGYQPEEEETSTINKYKQGYPY
jgi:hypothetical protein